MTDNYCYRCETPIDIQTDEWWSHSWEEHPAKRTVEKAIEAEDNGVEFRDFFKENFILCPDCHKRIVNDFIDHDPATH